MTRTLIATAVAVACGALSAWSYTRNHYVAEIAGMTADQATAREKAEKIARELLEAEQKRGNALSDTLAKKETAITEKTQELANALSRLTTGRKCLDARVVRVLNDSSTGTATDNVRATTGTSDAADGPAATDTDVASWINHAKGQYEICRARLGALIDFEKGRVQ
ncbi:MULTISPECIES: hypothetical protein [Ralstonia solanacearum species complex]|uniref:Lysis protein n=1 Tax=Ralstonia solanacearum (strain UW551) TaxID=342110 RepID=A0AB33VDF0_RALSU|nr:hypothetical protein [Ralstonia solanacearum]ALF87418.1 hypothetical protein RSUY_10450 [Ralstonia solanacearum]ATI28956.1 hypothetical protein CCY86_05225 [Ralstonia solanacearum]ATJ87706.1 hypothetical protein CDC59_05185 [Ralstonia solanacearum]EAP72768.1 Hypothetical Protein RRSL_02406 [Ralstonia solanacearum UW551]KEI33008.1 hypothetical protein CQ06_12885 [Ralstonia solanacearum]